MKILSFDSDNKIKRDPLQNNLFNLFQKNIINNQEIELNIYVVPREYEMRLDRISNHIYGSPDYVEELMVLNEIISPYSVKEGQYIYFCNINSLPLLYVKDNITVTNEVIRQNLINSSQPNRDKTKLSGTDKNLPPTIKPSNLDQVRVSKDFMVEIINSFE